MNCKRCNSNNVNIVSEQVSSKGKMNNFGFMSKIARFILICSTMGLWALVGKRKVRTKAKFSHKTVALCQNCGNKWRV